MRDWPGRSHVETLRLWPELSRVVEAIERQPELFLGAILIGSLSRGEGDALSDIDLVVVTQTDRWQEAWNIRETLSSGALATFDRFEAGRQDIAGHSWLTPALVKAECLVTPPGGMRLKGSAVVGRRGRQLVGGIRAGRAHHARGSGGICGGSPRERSMLSH